LEKKLGIKAELKVGPGGSFAVDVDGAVVAEKHACGFPSEEEIAAAVAKAIGSAKNTA
jgi:predicted Rdx family selenoprotein